MPNKYFLVDGIATHVLHPGETTLPGVTPDLSRGETVIALHDRGGNAAVFQPLARELWPEHTLLSFDAPGHGRSAGLDSLGSIARMADFSAGLAGKLAIESAIWLGHGLGAAVALELALSHASVARGLVLCCGATSFPNLEEEGRKLRRVTEGKERRPFDRSLYAEKVSPEVLKRGFGEGLKTDPRVGYGDLLACSEWAVGDRLAEIAAPTLVVAGVESPPADLGGADQLADGIPDASQVAIPDAGHMLPLEQPAALARALGSFLGDLSK